MADTDVVTRRELLQAGLLGLTGAYRIVDLGLPRRARPPLRFGVITDLHHGLAPDAATRLEAFVAEVGRRKELDVVVQMGDFCHAGEAASAVMDTWRQVRPPTLHVLGNHDMDRVDKATAMRFWGMPARYGAYEFGGYRFVVLDLNHFKKAGKLVAYEKGNYFTDNATHNWADPEQLDWLRSELRRGNKPTILLSHQPLGMAEPGQPLPPEQAEVLRVVTDARREHPSGAVVVCLCGHLHVDRVERHQGIPCMLVNSASYFWASGMYAYSRPLYAFFEITEEGQMIVEGAVGEFVKTPPADSDKVVGRSASIADRRIRLR